MARQLPSLHISQIIASDALLSPVASEAPWDPAFSPPAEQFSYNYFMSADSSAAASPVQPNKALKMRMSPDNAQEQESLCMPTHQVFELSNPQPPSAPAAPPAPRSAPLKHAALQRCDTEEFETSSTASKRSASPAVGANKKRATGERISSKDFVPPDVTGLSKREARLVKNRAAAFLSRQRKREEFETMEIRVAELEQENARLLALTQGGACAAQPQVQQPDPALLSEVEQLRARLAAAEERERNLAKLISSTTSASTSVPIKVEAAESFVPASPRPVAAPSANKTAASLGLMVLLCALPSLLSSLPMQTGAHANFSMPSSYLSPAKYSFDNIVPTDFDWTRSSIMKMDSDDHASVFSAPASLPKRLEFADMDTSELGDLNGLDISFDTSSTDNGKIRVRIHPSSSASSRATSPGASSQSSKVGTPSSSPMDMWSSENDSYFRLSHSAQGSPSIPSLSPSSTDPFLGDYGMKNDLDDEILSDFGSGSEYSVPDSTGAKRRVRIALKSPPSSSNEGGEWEVEIC